MVVMAEPVDIAPEPVAPIELAWEPEAAEPEAEEPLPVPALAQAALEASRAFLMSAPLHLESAQGVTMPWSLAFASGLQAQALSWRVQPIWGIACFRQGIYQTGPISQLIQHENATGHADGELADLRCSRAGQRSPGQRRHRQWRERQKQPSF